MRRLNPNVDIVLDILKAVIEDQPLSSFAKSLHHQYVERGGLSKKQLQGLYGKAQKVKSIPVNKLATLEAIIRQKKTKERSVLPAATPLFTKDEEAGKMIISLLEKFPQHKRVLFLKSKYDNNQELTIVEKDELRKFTRLLK